MSEISVSDDFENSIIIESKNQEIERKNYINNYNISSFNASPIISRKQLKEDSRIRPHRPISSSGRTTYTCNTSRNMSRPQTARLYRENIENKKTFQQTSSRIRYFSNDPGYKRIYQNKITIEKEEMVPNEESDVTSLCNNCEVRPTN